MRSFDYVLSMCVIYVLLCCCTFVDITVMIACDAVYGFMFRQIIVVKLLMCARLASGVEQTRGHAQSPKEVRLDGKGRDAWGVVCLISTG